MKKIVTLLLSLVLLLGVMPITKTEAATGWTVLYDTENYGYTSAYSTITKDVLTYTPGTVTWAVAVPTPTEGIARIQIEGQTQTEILIYETSWTYSDGLYMTGIESHCRVDQGLSYVYFEFTPYTSEDFVASRFYFNEDPSASLLSSVDAEDYSYTTDTGSTDTDLVGSNTDNTQPYTDSSSSTSTEYDNSDLGGLTQSTLKAEVKSFKVDGKNFCKVKVKTNSEYGCVLKVYNAKTKKLLYSKQWNINYFTFDIAGNGLLYAVAYPCADYDGNYINRPSNKKYAMTGTSIKKSSEKTMKRHSITLKWKKSSGAKYYEVWKSKYTNSGWKKVGTTKSTKYKISKVDNYYGMNYWVRPVAKKNGKIIKASATNKRYAHATWEKRYR